MGEVNLFTRPRRFGKSLNMSMIKTFFEIGSDESLLAGLEISGERELCAKYMGQFPVISIALKNVQGLSYEEAYTVLRRTIGTEARRFGFLMQSENLDGGDKDMYLALTDVRQGRFTMADEVMIDSLRTLTQLLAKHYGRKVILLIDEYDVPLEKAFQSGYYTEMVSLFRGLFFFSLKTNPDLHFAVLTVFLRIAKESIFTGLNNLKLFSITDVDCDSYFGFTDKEVRDMLAYYDLEEKYETIKEWYDGYCFGDENVYCPWDVINYVDRLQGKRTLLLQKYWINTSGNESVRYLIRKMGSGVLKSEIESLIAGETVEKEIHEELTYNEIYSAADNIWSLLFMTGYLTQRGNGDWNRRKLAIPNLEIRSIFTSQVLGMFREEAARDGALLEKFCSFLENGDREEIQHLFTQYLSKTISIRDTFAQKPIKENFYHGVLLGILGYKDGWVLKSNKESGNGYSDIFIRIEEQSIGIIVEVKYAENGQLEAVCRKAIQQIDRNKYAEELKREGCQRILKYGIACWKKECEVLMSEE